MSQVNYTVILKRTLEKLQNILGQLDMTLSELRNALTSAEYSAKITQPLTAEGNIPIHIKKSDVAIGVSPSFEDSAGNPVRALVDADHHAQVDVLSTANPPNLDVALSTRASESTLTELNSKVTKVDTDDVHITSPLTAEGNIPVHIKQSDVPIEATPSFEDESGNPVRALVDTDHHVQVDALSVANPPNLDVALSTRASETTLSDLRDKVSRTDVESETGVFSKRVDIRYDNVGLAKEATLSGIKSQTDKLTFDANSFLRMALASDEIGLAKESTLSSELTRLAKLKIYDDTLATPDWVNLTRTILRESKIIEDAVGLAKETTLSVVKETLAVSKPKHKNVTTNATAGTVDTITFDAPLNTILIENSSETYDLYVSFDGGTTFKKIRPLQVLAISGIAKSENITSISIKSDGASQPVEILYQTYI